MQYSSSLSRTGWSRVCQRTVSTSVLTAAEPQFGQRTSIGRSSGSRQVRAGIDALAKGRKFLGAHIRKVYFSASRREFGNTLIEGAGKL